MRYRTDTRKLGTIDGGIKAFRKSESPQDASHIFQCVLRNDKYFNELVCILVALEETKNCAKNCR